jgi:glycosyltransferase involved in cell wall biosynthesis
MNRRLKILYVAYPLLPLSEDVAGGAEQVLLTVAREVVSRGHDVTVAAAEGSSFPGKLFATGKSSSQVDDFERRNAEHEAAILEYLADHEFDLVHDMSGSFWQQAESIKLPTLATLHLPPEFYPRGAFWQAPSNVMFNGVSSSQAQRFSRVLGLAGLEIVTNGIDVERFPFSPTKSDYLLWMGRICEEKAPHVACAIAEQMSIPLVLAGQVYPFSYHHNYFDHEIKPRLARDIRFVDSPSLAQKMELLSNARALLVTSTVEETSSLIAMEAMACGTPVIAMRRGALPEVVKDGITGFLVEDQRDMCQSIVRSGSIVPQACREHVLGRFTAARMVTEYLQLYNELTNKDLAFAGRKEQPQAV